MIEFVGKVGVIARGTDFVCVTGKVLGDPRGEATFKVAIDDGVIGVGVWRA